MSDAKQAWDDVRDKASGLGIKLKLHFEQARSATAAEPQAAAGGQEGAGDAQQGTADEVKEALAKLRDAIDGAFEAMGKAARDEAVREDVKETGRSLTNALQATFADVSDELKKVFSRREPDA